MVNGRLRSFLSLSFVLMISGWGSNGWAGFQKTSPKILSAPGEVLVKLKKEFLSEPLMIANVQTLSGTKILTRYESVEGLYHVKTFSDNTQSILAYYESQPLVEYVEPNYLVSIQEFEAQRGISTVLPNDEKFSSLWGLYNVGQKVADNQEGTVDADIDAPEAWETTEGDESVVVAVIDTGIDYKHEDLAENMWINKDEVPNNNIDDDKNGFIDDIYGYDFFNKEGDPIDDNDHGTHVAGTIAAVGNNEKGVIGVAPKTKLMALKFLNASGGGAISDAILAVEYAIKMNANILNNSWGGGGFSRALFDIIGAANEKKIVYTAAAGNDSLNNDINPHYPSNYKQPNIISVGASNNRDRLADFSNYGPNTVHVVAPGDQILSSITGNRYDIFSGTSMATPHVSGAVALLLALEPLLTPLEVRKRLMRTTDEIISIRRRIASMGRLNGYNAIHDIPVPKGNPKGLKNWIEVPHPISTSHNYGALTQSKWGIEHKGKGVTYLKIHFSKFETEARYDVVRITGEGEGGGEKEADEIDGTMAPFWSYVIPGDVATLYFQSDDTVHKYGFDVDRYAYTTDLP